MIVDFLFFMVIVCQFRPLNKKKKYMLPLDNFLINVYFFDLKKSKNLRKFILKNKVY